LLFFSLFFCFGGVTNEGDGALELELLVCTADDVKSSSSLSAACVLDVAAAACAVVDDALVDATRLSAVALAAAGTRPAPSLGRLALLLLLCFLDISRGCGCCKRMRCEGAQAKSAQELLRATDVTVQSLEIRSTAHFGKG
jgi:hypothetical protein